MFYFSGNSAAIIIISIIALAILWVLREGKMDDVPPSSEGRVSGVVARVGWAPYWAALAMMLGLVIRSFTSNGVLLTILMVGTSALVWAWGHGEFHYGGGKESQMALAIVAGIGFFIGWIVRGTGLWSSILVIIAVTVAALVIRRPYKLEYLERL